MLKVRERVQRLYRWAGIAGTSLAIMTAFVIISVIVYFATGMGEVPPVEISVVTQDDDIILAVLEGRISAGDWEYLIFDERVNPPMMWTPAPADMEPRENIVLASGLPPATYRVQIRHKPTAKFILETKVTIGG